MAGPLKTNSYMLKNGLRIVFRRILSGDSHHSSEKRLFEKVSCLRSVSWPSMKSSWAAGRRREAKIQKNQKWPEFRFFKSNRKFILELLLHFKLHKYAQMVDKQSTNHLQFEFWKNITHSKSYAIFCAKIWLKLIKISPNFHKIFIKSKQWSFNIYF